MTETSEAAALTTALAVEAVAWERAPRYPGRKVNRRVVCADGYRVSVQASGQHYANDSGPSGADANGFSRNAPYWRSLGAEGEVYYPFTTFEIGNPSSDPEPFSTWEEYDSGGVWAWVPREVVAALLERHGGAVSWEDPA